MKSVPPTEPSGTHDRDPGNFAIEHEYKYRRNA
jgi:hypothetical protein